MDTFDDLQRPFPLFKAPIAHAALDGPGECCHCGEHAGVRFSEACYDCFRSGNIDRAIDTELGMVTLEDASKGRTHGLPLNDTAQLAEYELTPHPLDPRFPDDRWYHVHVESEHLIELLRTPRYHTWQGEAWLFCCKQPMVFRGSLPSDIFNVYPARLPFAIAEFLKAPDWRLTVGDGHGSHTYYTFTCSACGRLRFNEDCD